MIWFANRFLFETIMPAIKVLSSSNDGAFRAALRGVLGGDGGIGLRDRDWPGLDRLQAWMDAEPPDVLLLDCEGASQGAVLERVHAAFAPVRIIMIVAGNGHAELADMIIRGARGCIQKNVSPALWRKAILTVYDGDIWLNRSALLEILELLIGSGAAPQLREGPGQPLPDGRLTEREWEVARLVACGMTNKEVARSMTISDTTVKTHLKHIFNKLQVTRRSQIHGAGR